MDSATHLIEDLSAQVFASRDVRHRDSAGVDESVWAIFRSTSLDKTLAFGDCLDVRNASIVLRAAGHSAASIPACETMLANWLASRAGWEEDSSLPSLVTASDGWDRVPWGRFATALYFLRDGFICRCTQPTTVLRMSANVAGEPRDEMVLQGAAIEQSEVRIDADELSSLGALCRAAMMTGAMDAALELTVEHAAQRIQFGRPISQFQAVQQMLAQFAAQTAAASAALDIGVSDFSVFTAAVAKARVSEAVALTTEIAHQVCGAMGFTVEYPLQRFTRRLWAWREEYGNEFVWNKRIGTMVASRCKDGLWPLVSDMKAMVEAWEA